MEISKKKKQKPTKLKLYAKNDYDESETLYDVSKFESIVKLFTASTPMMLEALKVDKLPIKIYLEKEDLLGLNELIFNVKQPRYFKLYLSTQRGAKPVVMFEDIKHASGDDLYKISPDDKKYNTNLRIES